MSEVITTGVEHTTKITAWLETKYGEKILLPGLCVIGRDESNQIILRTSAVSRRHALIHEKDSEFWIVDLGSFNGFLVNDQKVVQPVRLRTGDRIEIPFFSATFHQGNEIDKNSVPDSQGSAIEAKPSIAKPHTQATEIAANETAPPFRKSKLSGKGWAFGLVAGLVLAGLGLYYAFVTLTGKGQTSETAQQEIIMQPEPQSTSLGTSPNAVQPWINGLGMKFVPAGTAHVLFCTCDVRVQDFQAYVAATHTQVPDGIFVTKVKTNLNGEGSLVWEYNPNASWKNPGFDLVQGLNDPVVGVNWFDAKAFCQWLTQKEQAEGKLRANQQYRLPTDAEWSAAVGTGKYPWGDAWPPPEEVGNYGDQALAARLPGTGWNRVMLPGNDSYSQTSPVGSFRANAYGLYDMGGNVWQWCEDWYQASMNSDDLRKKIPALNNDKGGHTYKVLRGASWDDNRAEYALSSCRSYDYPNIRYSDRGFRVVLAETP